MDKGVDKGVEEYLKKQKSPQREIIQQLREIILKTFPDIKEEMKFGVPWYAGKYYLVALRDHVNIGFSVQGLSKKEQALFEGKGKLMRHLKIFSLKEINEKKIVRLLKLVKDKAKCDCPCWGGKSLLTGEVVFKNRDDAG